MMIALEYFRKGFGLLAFLLLTVLLSPSLPAAVAIRVAPDRNPVAMNESFDLVFSAEEAPDDDPDFSPLEQDFRILNQGRSNQVSIVNGSFKRKTAWTLTLMSKHPGNIAIPPIAFGDDRSEAAAVTVVAAAEESAVAGASELLLEVQAEPRNPYVQAQVRFTVRVLRRVNFNGAELSEPVVADALVERLGEDRAYQAERAGQAYAVIERQYALFPQKSGVLKIPPLTLEAQIPGGGRSRFNNFFGQGSRVARVQSKAVELNVRPIPSEFTGKHWLPAESLELTETWSSSPPQTAVGEPITRTLVLKAMGATVGVLPELDTGLAAKAGDQLKLYPDQPALNEEKRPDGILGSRQEKLALLPGRPGSIVLPAVRIPWWNTHAGRMEVAELPERTLSVTGEASAATPLPAPGAPVQGSQDLQESAAQSPTAALSAPPAAGTYANPWFWTSLAGFSGWLLTALFWWGSGRRPKAVEVKATETATGLRAATQALKQACAGDDPGRVRDALLLWGKARWPQNPPAHLTAIAERVGGEFAGQVAELERGLYGRSELPWQGGRLWELLAVPEAKSGITVPAELEPLYRR